VNEAHLEYSWFFRAEFPGVLRTVFLILHDRGRSEDVTQEAFIQLLAQWKKVSRYDRPDAWVRRVAIRQAVRMMKRDRMRTELERIEASALEPDLPDVDLARAVQALPAMQRVAVVLFYFEDRPIADIADILDISDGSVKVHLHRARQRLAAILEGEVGRDAR
jgi:RNA polymerase sigma-70 factor (ECF subfamily)